MRWGLVPSWSKEPKSGPPLINARGETVAEKPAFQSAFKKRRCLIPGTGFYEWKTEGKQKCPFNIHLPDDIPFAFAGLWECWRGGDEPLESCTIVTTAASEQMLRIHDRQVYYNRERPHEAKGHTPPAQEYCLLPDEKREMSDVISHSRLGGQLKSYSRRAA